MTIFSNVSDDAVNKAKRQFIITNESSKNKLDFSKISPFNKLECPPPVEVGLKAIANGEVALMVLSGGQGTRLGIPHAKGVIDLNLNLSPGFDSTLSIFAKRLHSLQEWCKDSLGLKESPQIPMILMTSSYTDKEIKDFINSHVVGEGILKADQIIIEQQLNIPCVDLNGEVIKKSPEEAQISPDGNGGFLDCLKKCDKFLKQKNVKYLHVISVDNCLSKVCDPLAVGSMIRGDADVLNKVVKKRSATESCGIMVKVNNDDGSYTSKIIEYSEMPKEIGGAVLGDGELKFQHANICSHYFNVEWLRSLYENDVELPYHRALKKIPYYDEEKKMVCEVDKPNGIKLEKFIFDVFDFARKVIMYEVPRCEEFAPIKNADSVGVDCIKTSREALGNLINVWMTKNGLQDLYSKWLKAHNLDMFFLDPLLTYDGEGKVFEMLKEIFEKNTIEPSKLNSHLLSSSVNTSHI
uniref:UDP-N-acetylglucosamine diphosphorylase n=1 Tax=Strongyloides stercoralis TaxID=6248 RepID=A0A0K0E1A9_STRER